MTYYRNGSEVTLQLSAQQQYHAFGSLLADGDVLVQSEDRTNPNSGNYIYTIFDGSGAAEGTGITLHASKVFGLADGNLITVAEPSSNGDSIVLNIADTNASNGVSTGTYTISPRFSSISLSEVSVVSLTGANAGKIAVVDNVVFGSGDTRATFHIIDLATGSVGAEVFASYSGRDMPPTLTELADGSLLTTAWDNGVRSGQHGFTISIRGLDGVAVVAPTILPLDYSLNPSELQVAALADGGFVVTWSENKSSNGYAGLGTLHAQVFDAKGLAATQDIIISQDGPRFVGSTDVAGLADGGFAIVWASKNVSVGTDGYSEISVRAFDASGADTSAEQIVNTTTAGDQMNAQVIGTPDGGFKVLWQDANSKLHSQEFYANAGQTFEGTSGADKLTGTDKDDLFLGHGGNDTIVGGAGVDTVSFADAAGAVYVTLATTKPIDTISAGTVVLKEIENAIGSDFNDTIYGSKADNRLEGAGGDDTIKGAEGNDTLLGGGGHDVLDGGAGADRLEGGAGNDKLYGGAGKDVLLGGDGDDLLDGGAAGDSMTGGAGSDTYYVDSPNDRVLENTGDAGIDKVYARVSYTLTDGVERLTLVEGAGNLKGTGNAANNVIVGNSGNNVLSGGGGVDVVTGGAGSDTFLFDLRPEAASRMAITDFTTGVDKIALALGAFDDGFPGAHAGAVPAVEFGYGTRAANPVQSLVYDQATGNLWYDADGSGSGKAIRIATLNHAPDLHLSDIIFV